ncbi:hypothetical protein LCGC14_1278540 [marine sediment metagenome]|uniref:Uncharacterized protein n=1 Tax=marine sediment metagenome TaxID=412755 RepID=A0A0F9KXN7_9ZZZZ
MVMDSNAVLRRMGLLFLMRMRRFIPIPMVVSLGIEMVVADGVLYALVRVRVRMPVAIRMGVSHRLGGLSSASKGGGNSPERPFSRVSL